MRTVGRKLDRVRQTRKISFKIIAIGNRDRAQLLGKTGRSLSTGRARRKILGHWRRDLYT